MSTELDVALAVANGSLQSPYQFHNSVHNKYYRWYMQLCSGWPCVKDMADDYTERHHIIPRSMGGSNAKANTVKLSYRKHFLAHWLLVKCTEGEARVKMLAALFCMSRAVRSKRRIISGWQFARAKAVCADPEYRVAHSERAKKHNAELNADPEFRAAHSERAKKLNANPAFKAANSERAKKRNADPAFQVKCHAAKARKREMPGGGLFSEYFG